MTMPTAGSIVLRMSAPGAMQATFSQLGGALQNQNGSYFGSV